jgi:uroporphyrinogen III methyltransferase/synthase
MRPGRVFLVGAGPGDPGLITLRGLQCLQAADAVVYDRLVDNRLLARARPGAELIDAGKVPGEERNRQTETNALLVRLARQGKQVVRLKGGDPFVFGRGGEEAEALQEEGIPFEVVPGVTSAIAAPAYAGIPLTHRRLASSFAVVTGSEDPQKDGSSVAWNSLAQQGGTLVVLMGWENFANIVQTLVQYGRSPGTPVAVVQWGTEPYQRTVVGTLSDIVGKANEAGLSPPVVVVVGEVVELRDKLRWFDSRPLFGKRVLVTRTRTQAGTLSELLSRRGAQPIEVPTIEIRPLEEFAELDGALRRLHGYDWVVFTSVNAVQSVFGRLETLGLDARAFRAARVAAIGPATAASLREHGIIADFVPDSFVSEAVVEGLKGHGMDGCRVLLPRADLAREALASGLSSLGAAVHEVAAYRTVTPEDAGARLREILTEGIDVATFTSSSTVRNLAQLLDGDLGLLSGVTIACIGPITAAGARELGLNVDIVASEYTVEGLVDALEAHFARDLA